MKKIKKFESFINEELSPSTYREAAKKLKQIGHRNRAEKMNQYVDDMAQKQEQIEIEWDNKTYKIDFSNFKEWSKPENSNLEMVINLDPEFAEAQEKNDYKTLWNKLSKEEKKKFHDEYKSLIDDDKWAEYILDGEVLNDVYDEMSTHEKEYLEEYMMMSSPTIMIETDDRGADISGIIVKDRKTAVKILKLIKNWAKFKGGKYEKYLSKIKVNDLYRD